MIPIARPFIGAKERRAVDRVLRSGGLAQGPEVYKFEQEFSAVTLDGRSAVAVNSGTSGQHLGLLASQVKQGGEVIVPSFTFAASPNSIALCGAVPVFCDIDPTNFTLDLQHFRALIGPRTLGVMPVHLYGHPANMTEIMNIATSAGIDVYEDAAQAHGAEVDGQRVGTFGKFAMFSFYPTKNMTSGEGGMVACSTEEVARNVRLLRNQGMEKRYENEIIGFNNRMTDIHAAIGRVQLARLPRWNEIRRENAQFLSSNLEGVETPKEESWAKHVYHQYTIRVREDRDGFAAALKSEFGIETGIYYPVPTHRLPSLAKYAKDAVLPETDRAAREALSLPIHPALTRTQLGKIVRAVNRLSRAGG